MTTEMDPPAGSGPVRLVRFAPGKPAPAQLSARGRAALYYAEHFGWSVFPLHSMRGEGVLAGGSCSCGKDDCSRRAKHPRTPNGLKDATRDPDTIERWWRQWPDANVGVRTGELEPGDPNSPRLVVLDIDPRHNGNDTFDELVALLGALPDSVEALTGGGGRHLFLTGPEGVPVPCSVGGPERGLGPGIDIRADGGYVVVAPSDHESGREYAWEASGRPDEVKLAPWPVAWMNRMLTAKGRSNQSDDASEGATGGAGPLAGSGGEPISEGGRNQTLFSRGCSMRRGGFDRAAILAALTAENDSRCVPPLPATEVRAIVGSCMKYKPGGPKPTDGGAKTGGASAAAGAPTAANANTTTEGTLPAEGESDWRSQLKYDNRGGLRRSYGNLCVILAHAPEYQGRFRLNEMTGQVEDTARENAPLTDAVVGALRWDLERDWSMEIGADAIFMAARTIAESNRYHPVREYLGGLVWDGVARIDRVPAEILGCTEPMAIRKVQAFLVSCVARAMRPGEKVDTVFVLVGKQGAQKSKFFHVLGAPWFSDSHLDITNKDAFLMIAATWIYEWGEVEKITSQRRADEVKAFLTSCEDHYRAPYARSATKVPRGNVFVGTTNSDEFLVDDTGNRRWWPLTVPGDIDLETLGKWRDQLWAEAYRLWEEGYQFWLTRDEDQARERHDERYRRADEWEEPVRNWLMVGWPKLREELGLRFLTAHAVMAHGLGLVPRDMRKGDKDRVGRILKRLGFQSRVVRLRHDDVVRWQEITGIRTLTAKAWVPATEPEELESVAEVEETRDAAE